MIALLIKSLIVGALMGLSVGAGAARMFHAPAIMSAGAFRTIGELNACAGDSMSHITFGLSYYLSTWADNVAHGGMGQDFMHRTIPNVGAGILLAKNKNVEETLHDPFKMAMICAPVGAVLYALMNCTGNLVPAFVTSKMMEALTPAASYLMIIMQILYLIACLENGVYTGICGLILGSVAYLATGNACSGLILGILTGKTIEANGIKSKISIIFIVLMTVIWGYICYARGFWGNALNAFSSLSQLFVH